MADSGLKGQTGDWLCWAGWGPLARLQDEPDAEQVSSLPSLPLRECSSCRRESDPNDFTEQMPVCLLPLPKHFRLLPVNVRSSRNYISPSWVMKVNGNFQDFFLF